MVAQRLPQGNVLILYRKNSRVAWQGVRAYTERVKRTTPAKGFTPSPGSRRPRPRAIGLTGFEPATSWSRTTGTNALSASESTFSGPTGRTLRTVYTVSGRLLGREAPLARLTVPYRARLKSVRSVGQPPATSLRSGWHVLRHSFISACASAAVD